jgi:hypothetical protein
MTFNPRALWASAAFVAVLLLAVNARAGRVDMRFVLAGIAAIVVIEALVIFGPAIGWSWRKRPNAENRL